MIGEDKLVHFSGVACGEACTIVLRGASTHLLDEAERSLHDALCVLHATVQVQSHSLLVSGDGWTHRLHQKSARDADDMPHTLTVACDCCGAGRTRDPGRRVP